MAQFSHYMWALLGRPVWEKRGGVVASVRSTDEKQRRTRKSGNAEGKAIILEMGQKKSLVFSLCATSFAVEIVFRSECMGYGVLSGCCV